MKKIKLFLLMITAVLIGLFAAACGKTLNINYQLTFHMNCGGATITVRSEAPESMKIPNNPVRENYTFEGWFWDDGEWEEPFTINSILDQPVSERMEMNVYAKWKGVDVTVAYESGVSGTKTLEYGKDFVLSVPTGEDGDVFLGWQLLDGETSRFVTDGKGVSLAPCDFLAATVTPVWKDGKIVLSLDAQGGTIAQMTAVVWQGETFGELPTPQRKGFTFVGWSFTADGTEKILPEDTVSLTENATVYAVWEKEAVIWLQFDGNGSDSGFMQDQSFLKTNEVVLPKNQFVKSGYAFDGWVLNGKTYGEGERVTLDYGEYLLTAAWRLGEYTVRFDGAATDTVGEMSPQTFTCGTPQALNSNALTRKGYLFAGWMLDGKTHYEDGAQFSVSAEHGDEFVLTAQWTPISYRIYYKVNADDNNEECRYRDYTYGQSFNVGYLGYENGWYVEIYKDGYNLTGWKQVGGELDGTIWDVLENTSNLSAQDGGVIEMVGVWTAITYDLYYRYSNGGSGAKIIQDVPYDQAHVLLEPWNGLEKEGYAFAGWRLYNDWFYTGSEGLLSKVFQPGDEIKELVTYENETIDIYPEWKPISYSVKVHIGDDANTVYEYEKTYDEDLSIPLNALTLLKDEYTLEGFRVGHKGIQLYWTDKENGKPGRLLLTDDYCTEQDGLVELRPLWKYKYQGSGTVEDPYVVDNAAAMENMGIAAYLDYAFVRRNEGDWVVSKVCFSFTADIDMTGRTFTPIGVFESAVWKGVINGNGHTVTGLKITLPEDITDVARVGFVCEMQHAEISGLHFKDCSMDVSVEQDKVQAAFIVSDIYYSTVRDCSLNNVEINVANTGDVIAAAFQATTSYGNEFLKNIYFNGKINVTAGGKAEVGTIGCYGSKIETGGAQASVNVTAGGNVTFHGLSSNGNSSNAYTVFNAKITGKALTLTETAGASYYSDESSVTFNGEAYTLNAEKKAAAEDLKNPDWVAAHIPALRTTSWTMENGYPTPGSRTLSLVEIATKDEFLALSGKNLTERYVLLCDIDMSGITWEMPSVYGEFDGGGHKLTGYAVTDFAAKAISVFERNYGTIKNVVVENVNFLAMATENAVYMAGLVIENRGTVAYCKVSGTMLADIKEYTLAVGGIAALNYGHIYCCYTDCTIDAKSYQEKEMSGRMDVCVCGIAYNQGGLIEDCYTMGNLKGVAEKPDIWGNVCYAQVGGVSNEATDCFSLTHLTYASTSNNATKHWMVAAGPDGQHLTACAVQTYNGTAVSGGISENFLKNEAYLLQTYGWKKYVDAETLAGDCYAAWKFVSDGYPILYFE